MAALTRTRHPGIYRRGPRYVIVYRDRQGKQKQETTDTLAEAQALRAERVAAVKGGSYRERSKQRLDDYLRGWIEGYTGLRGGGFRENTREEYRRLIERYIIPRLGHLTLAELAPADIRELGHWLHNPEAQGKRRAEAKREEKAKRLGVSPSTLPLEVKPVLLADRTVARIVTPLSAALTTAVGDGLIDRNPARDVVLPKRDHQRAIDEGRDLEPAPVKAMTNDELTALLNACPTEWQPLFRLLAGTGLRWSEAAALRWQDVDLSGPNPQVRVRRAHVRGRMGPPKSKASRREVLIGPDVVEHLKAHYELTQWAGPDHLVFSSQAGTPLTHENVRNRVLHPAAKKAGLVRPPKAGGNPVPWVGFHTFRHTCATRLFREGRNAKQVQRWLGHHSAAFTLETYIHLLSDDQDAPLPPPEVVEVAAGVGVEKANKKPTDHPTQGDTGRQSAVEVFTV